MARAFLPALSFEGPVRFCQDEPAEEFFRSLYREHRLSDAELSGRLRALDDLAAGKLIPPLPRQG